MRIKTFSEFLSEAEHVGVPVTRGKDKGHIAPVYKNPNRKELNSITQHDQVGGFLHGNDMYAFNRMHHLHGEIEHHLGVNTHDLLPVVIYHDKKTSEAHFDVTDSTRRTKYHHSPEVHSTITKHPHVNKLWKRGVSVSYYDEDIRGAWHE